MLVSLLTNQSNESSLVGHVILSAPSFRTTAISMHQGLPMGSVDIWDSGTGELVMGACAGTQTE